MNKTLSLMGLCRRAGKLVTGHDAVMLSVRNNRAQAVILLSDASPRHKKELGFAGFADENIILLDLTTAEAAPALGKKCCIYAVEDESFASALKKTNREEKI